MRLQRNPKRRLRLRCYIAEARTANEVFQVVPCEASVKLEVSHQVAAESTQLIIERRSTCFSKEACEILTRTTNYGKPTVLP